ncbi:MAG: hypothetical protein ACR2JP_01040 [Acidimicrobiia bacterium]
MDTTTPSPIDPDDAVLDELPDPHPDDLLARLAGADPGESPAVADRLADELERRLDGVS